MLQLTSAISCAHDSYIIHRDVKPQNVMILEDGRVKIMDFGIAMALNSNELTQTNSVMGSVHYLPPEQANGKGSTMKSDIYSLGILMFELLTGKLPFRGDQAVEIAIKQMKEPIPSVCKINPNIPQSIENIILKACAKNPKNRYDSVKEMREDIEKSMDPEHQFEERHVYKFPEQDLEETKIMPPIKDVKKEQPEEIIFLDEEEEKPKKEKKKKNNKKWLLVGGAVVSTLIILLLVFLLVLKPMFTKEKEIRIPNVKEMTLEQAKEIITNNGEINITLEIKEEYNDTVESGRVIETKPKIGNSVKVGTKITIIISKGKEGLEVVDYKNQKLSEIEEMLEKAGIIVKTEEREISEETDEDKDGVIVDQDVEVGTYLKNGDSITLTYNKLVAVYPDFTDGTWNEESIREFCERNDIIPTVKMVENGAQPEGTILSQSRAAKTKIYKNTSIVIEIAKKPTVVEKPPISDDQNDDNKEDGKDDIGNDESKTE